MSKNDPHCIRNVHLEDSGLSRALTLVGGKYKISILHTLSAFEVVRFNEMQRFIGSISCKALSAALKELEADGLIIRTEYPQVPPKVEYSLSALGKSLTPILNGLCRWGEENCLP